MNKKRIYYIVFAAIAGGALSVLLLRSGRAAESSLRKGVVRGAKHDISVLVADTEATREQGLSGTDPLAPHAGMWFSFPEPGSYGFWMKDMKYPLDIVWIGAENKVVYVEKHFTPESYPKVVAPAEPAQYVLEIGSGQADAEGIAVGATLSLDTFVH